MDFRDIIVKESPGLCRCCLSEGCYKDLGSEYSWMNENEIYADMLLECFDISISQHNEGPNGPNRLICEVCITRLRDACNFKKQVLDSEKKFVDMVGRGEFRSKVLIYQAQMKAESEDVEMDNDAEVEYLEDDLDLGDDVPLKSYKKQEPTVSKDITVATLPLKTKRGRPKKAATAVKSEKKAKLSHAEEKPRSSKAVIKGNKPNVANQYTVKDVGDGLKLFICKTCNRKFEGRNLFRQHYVTVHLKLGRKTHSCNRCGLQVEPYKRALHLEEAHGVPRPTCNVCGKKFPFPNQVMWHQRKIHMGEKKFQCPDCPYKFATSYHLKVHQVKHTGERPHKCEYCGKTFKWKKSLQTHLMIHMDVRKHVCKACGDAFVQSTSLKYHITRRHPDMV